MQYYKKGENRGFFSKGGIGGKILGGAKMAASALDNGVAEAIVGAIAPELGVGLHAARTSGLLERLKK
jgi:hypothetical protein